MVLLSVAGASVATAAPFFTSSKLDSVPDFSARAAELAGGKSSLNETLRGLVLCQMTGARRSRWRSVMLVGDVVFVSCKHLVENLLPLQGAEVHVQDSELTIVTKCSQECKFWLESEEQAQQWSCEMKSAGLCVERIKELEVAVAGIPEYQRRLAEQQNRMTQLEEEISGQQKAKAELEKVIAGQRQKTTELEEVIGEQRIKVAELGEVIALQEKKTAELEETIASLQGQLADAQGFATKKNNQLATLQGDLEDLMVTALPEALNRVHEVLKERVKSAGDNLALLDDNADQALMDVDIVEENGTAGVSNSSLCDETEQDLLPTGDSPAKENIGNPCNEGQEGLKPTEDLTVKNESVGTPGPLGTSKKMNVSKPVSTGIRARSSRSPPPSQINIRVGSPSPKNMLSLGPDRGIRVQASTRGQKP